MFVLVILPAPVLYTLLLSGAGAWAGIMFPLGASTPLSVWALGDLATHDSPYNKYISHHPAVSHFKHHHFLYV